MSNFPVAEQQLTQIATEACTQAFGSSTEYTHSKTHDWNQSIINRILQSLIDQTTIDGEAPHYKFAVNSTIIQHRFSGSSSGGGASGDAAKTGMNSSMGAYWNNAKDGMWSFKWEGQEKGMDAVISVIWVAVD